jgi:uncharacterized protein
MAAIPSVLIAGASSSVGFDRREAVTIPPLHDAGQWDAFQAARQTVLPGFAQVHAAERYRTSAGLLISEATQISQQDTSS